MSNNTGNRDPLAMSEVMKYVVSLTCLLIGSGVIGILFMLREQNEKQDSDALIPLVETTQISTFEGDLDLEVSGTVVPFREIRIGAEVAGVIAKKYAACQAGNLVQLGTPLLEIDRRNYELEIKTLDSEILQAKRTIEETEEEISGAEENLKIAKSDLELQKNEYQRIEDLANSISEAELDQAKRALLNTQSQYTIRDNNLKMLLKKKQRLESSLELVRSRMKRAELNLQRTEIKAPASGVIVQENVEQGDFVSVGSDLLIFECTAQVEVLCNLTPGELDWIRRYVDSSGNNDPNGQIYGLPQLKVELYEKNNPNFQWEGILERFDGIGLNETTKSIPCRIVVKEPVTESKNGRKKALVRGMYLKCRMVLPVSHLDTELAIFPASALRPGDYVWVVRNDKLNRFDVNVVDRSPPKDSFADRVVVDLGDGNMVVGDQVVTSPLPQPVEGGQVLMPDRALPVEIPNDETVGSDMQPVGDDRQGPEGIRSTTKVSADVEIKDRS